MTDFDYYIFIDYSENLLGYLIVDTKEIPKIKPKITRLRHYREAGDKKSYIRMLRQLLNENNC